MNENKIDELNHPGVERALLSLLATYPERCDECLGKLKAEDFGIKANSIVYSTLMQLTQIDKLKEIDSITLYNAIKDSVKPEIDKLNGLSYIQALFDSELSDNLDYYMKEILKFSEGRKIIKILHKTEANIVAMDDETQPLVELLQMSEKLLDIKASDTEGKKFGDGTKERILKRLDNPREVAGIPIGWEKWDKLTQGFAENDMVVFLGGTGAGKSTLLLNMSERLVRSGLKGLYLDTEMINDEQEDRFLSILSGVPNEEIRNGMAGQDTPYGKGELKKKKLLEAIDWMEGENCNLRHINIPQFTIDKIIATIRQYKKKDKIDFVVFDYIKMPSSGSAMSTNTAEWQQLGYLASALKEVANQLKIPILTAVQTNKAGEKATEFSREIFGGSDRILHNATKAYLLRRKTDHEMEEEGHRHGNMLLQIGKQRHGGLGKTININFEGEINKMKEVD